MAEEWWRSAVVYQVYPRSFADSDGDGVGDLRGLIRWLDYLSRLGIDAIWLSPVYPSPQDDNGYDISDYEDIDPLYGTLAEFDELVAEAHARDIRIVIDVVVNHTSDEHPWFIASRSSREDPKRDWYWWRPPRAGFEPGTPGAEPTNWASFFSGPAWEYDETTSEYFLHLFSRKQPDLNWANPEVRQAVYAMLRFWLDRGVDGFRMDVINMVSKAVAPDGSLPDGRPGPGAALGDGTPHFICGPRIHEFLHELHDEALGDDRATDNHRVDGNTVMTVGEMPGVTVQEAELFTDPARDEVDMVFQFEHVGIDHGDSKWDVKPFRLLDLKATFGRWQAGLAHRGWNSLYWNNHDQPRVVSRFGDDGEFRVESAKLLGTVLHLHRGTPYVFQGEEIGMTNAGFDSIDDYRDIESLNHYAAAVAAGEPPAHVLEALRKMSRDNARTPMQWDDTEHGGFTTGTPWLAVNPSYESVNAAAAEGDPDSVFHHYRRLIELRHEEPVVVHGDFTMLLPDHDVVYAFTRRLDCTTLLVLANFSGQPVTVDLPDADTWAGAEFLLGSYGTAEELAERVTLRPWEARVHRRRES